jgi:hypothetical protein
LRTKVAFLQAKGGLRVIATTQASGRPAWSLYLLVVFGLTAVFLFIGVWRPSAIRDQRAAAMRECRNLYSQARTFADTLRADAVFPQRATMTGPRRVLTCWDFRRSGWFDPFRGDTVHARSVP